MRKTLAVVVCQSSGNSRFTGKRGSYLSCLIWQVPLCESGLVGAESTTTDAHRGLKWRNDGIWTVNGCM